MKRGVQAVIPFFMYDASTFDGVSGLLDVSVRISKDGGATSSTTNSAVEIDATYLPGWYKVTLITTEMDCGILILQATSATAKADPIVIETTPADYATASGLSALQNHGDSTWATASVPTADIAAIKAKTDNLPLSPAATGDAMTLTSDYNAARTPVDVGASLTAYGAAKTTDIPSVESVQYGLATSGQIAALEAHGDVAWAGVSAENIAHTLLTTPADAGRGNTLQNALRAVTGNWVLENDTLKIKTANGNTVLAVALTKDSDGNFIGASL